jgi:hypothetical protein
MRVAIKVGVLIDVLIVGVMAAFMGLVAFSYWEDKPERERLDAVSKPESRPFTEVSRPLTEIEKECGRAIVVAALSFKTEKERHDFMNRPDVRKVCDPMDEMAKKNAGRK